MNPCRWREVKFPIGKMDEKDGVSSRDEGGTAETEASGDNVDSESGVSGLQNHVDNDMSVDDSFTNAHKSSSMDSDTPEDKNSKCIDVIYSYNLDMIIWFYKNIPSHSQRVCYFFHKIHYPLSVVIRQT